MTGRSVTLAVAAAVMTACVVTSAPVAGQTSAPADTSWTPPRTPDGQPDIQGFWANQTKRLATYDLEGPAPIEPDRLRYEATFDDPKVYARPFTIGLTLGRAVRGEDATTYGFLEEACREGERNIQHMLFRLGGRP